MAGQPPSNTATSGSNTSQGATDMLGQLGQIAPVQIPGMGNGMGGGSPLGSVNNTTSSTTAWSEPPNVGHQQGNDLGIGTTPNKTFNIGGK
jgi:hypothetical protein